MLLHNSRRDERINATGELVLLEDQDRSRWKADEILEGVEILDNALRMGAPGVYQVQAAISALHAQAPSFHQTDWAQIAALYGVLLGWNTSPVVALNHAVAVAMSRGVNEGLRLMLRLEDELGEYYPYHAARADLLRRTGQREAAAEAYERALALCGNTHERAYFQRRLSELSTYGE
jgi:RNA polymerase sigma-70 factor, ECF subfamily